MQITVHVDGYYDWEPLPKDATDPTAADIEAKRVKPDGLGGWLMKVKKKLIDGNFTHTSIGMPETQIIAAIVEEMTRGDRQPLTRAAAVARYLTRHVMPHHAHKDWMHEVQVHDDGPDPELFGKIIAEHVKAGNIATEDVESLTNAYVANVTADFAQNNQAVVDHLHKHFGIKPEKHKEFRARREANTPKSVVDPTSKEASK